MNIIYLPTESCDHFQELFLESDLFWVEEGRGDGIISVNFEYFSHINYRLQTIWIKFCMGMNPTGSTDSHFVLSSVILFALWLHHLIRMLPKLLHIHKLQQTSNCVLLLLIFPSWDCTLPSSRHSSLSCSHRRLYGQIHCHPRVVAPCTRVAQFPYLARTKF